MRVVALAFVGIILLDAAAFFLTGELAAAAFMNIPGACFMFGLSAINIHRALKGGSPWSG